MEKRYLLSPDGVPVKALPGEYDHADVARRLLKERGIAVASYGEIYTRVFAIGYARVVEFDTIIFAENDNRVFSRPQREYLEDRHLETHLPVNFLRRVPGAPER